MNAGDFSTFVEAIHGYRPFPWQTELARRVVEGEGWPAMIAAPTAAGKTLVIDLAVFALACSVDSSARPPAPRRTFFVIDRRVVVDAAFDRAVRLAQALREPRHLVVAEVAERLLALGGEVPLETVALRGGVSLDQAWARSPAQPLVCVSTVDQVGSRLLFRGYGLGRGPTNLLPIHAALVGNDALIILDEAHLSRPFADTLSAVGRYRTWAEGEVTSPWIVVHMTATPEPGCEEPFTIGDEDRADSVLGPRLAAKKPARLVEVRTQAPQKGDSPHERRRLERDNRTAHVETICREALTLLSHDQRARVVAVVVNRVAVAREIFESLRTESEAILLTGRARSLERERLLERYLPRIEARRKEDAGDGPLFVVATQTIEVGADLDFDGLVTECASLDALRQRFGRLDRLGERRESWAVIVSRRDQVAKGAEDFVYGPSLGRTWSWLKGMAERPGGEGVPGNPVVDMGVMSLPMPAATELLELLPPARRAPVLLPAHLDLWTQTAPMPLPDPDPALFLHGPSTEPPDVCVVWRADLDEAPSDTWANIVALAPPTPPEAIPVPAYATRRWLTGAGEEEIADVEGAQVRSGEEIGQGKVILRWRGPGSDETMPIGPAQVRPGDTIVVPASYGG
ncbi:MAG: type I-U CRISPR-associated helicase/endonuclease Cas3, partial [bacterium]